MSEFSKAFSQALSELSPEEQANRTQIARFREVFDDIEAALSAGYPQAFVRAKLAENGLAVKATTFTMMLRRVRVERQAAALAGAAAGQHAGAPIPVLSGPPPAKVPALPEEPPPPLTAKQERDKVAAEYIKPEASRHLKKISKPKDKEA